MASLSARPLCKRYTVMNIFGCRKVEKPKIVGRFKNLSFKLLSFSEVKFCSTSSSSVASCFLSIASTIFFFLFFSFSFVYNYCQHSISHKFSLNTSLLIIIKMSIHSSTSKNTQIPLPKP